MVSLPSPQNASSNGSHNDKDKKNNNYRHNHDSREWFLRQLLTVIFT